MIQLGSFGEIWLDIYLRCGFLADLSILFWNMVYSSYWMCIQNFEGLCPAVGVMIQLGSFGEIWLDIYFRCGFLADFSILFWNMVYSSYEMGVQNFVGYAQLLESYDTTWGDLTEYLFNVWIFGWLLYSLLKYGLF